MPQDPATKAKHKANQSSFRKVGFPALAIGGLADGLSTHHALNQPGLHEANPIYGRNPSGAKIGAIKGATTAAQALALDKLAKKKPKLAKALAVGFGLIQAGLAANNMRLAGKAKKK